MQLTNKTVFVTGGASGIGAACTKALLEKGAKVVVADIDEVPGTQLVQDLSKQYGQDKVMFVRYDVADATNFKDAFQQAVTTFKHVDVMVNNAGIMNEDNWGKLLDVNLRGVIHGTEMAEAHMRKNKGGQGGVIINMASVAGYTPVFFLPVYVASKHAVIGYTRSLAGIPDIREQGVRYACICPQMIDTPIFNDMDKGKCRGYLDEAHQITSVKKLSPKSVAEGLLSLIADDDSNDTLLEICAEGLVRKKIRVENA